MKRLICVCVLIFCGLDALYAQPSSAKVDERFELTSIVCRLAGAEEYMQCRVPAYAKDIDNYFFNYLEHPIIDYYKTIRKERGISYNAISSMANVLEISNGKIRINREYELRHLADTSELRAIDYRWTKAILNRYLILLNDFYKKSKFREFYNAHQPLYIIAESRMDTLLNKFDAQWFEEFYGQPFGTPQVYVSLCNGSSNYSLPTYKESEPANSGILIGTKSDSKGMPSFNSVPTLCTIIHELAHIFSNPLAAQYSSQLENAIAIIAPHIENQLEVAAYSPQAIAPEWLTRLAVLMYLKDRDPDYVPFMLNADCRAGFIWQERALNFMENFTHNRAQYKYFADFIPQLIGFYNFSAQEIDKIMAEYNSRVPYIVSVYPAIDTEIDIRQSVTEFRLLFSRPMRTNSDGIYILGRPELLSESDIPENFVLSEWETDRIYIVRFTGNMIDKGKINGFTLPSKMFQSATDMSTLPSDYKVTFK